MQPVRLVGPVIPNPVPSRFPRSPPPPRALFLCIVCVGFPATSYQIVTRGCDYDVASRLSFGPWARNSASFAAGNWTYYVWKNFGFGRFLISIS